MKARFHFFNLAALLFCIPMLATAQITVTANDLLGLRGKAQVYEEDQSGSITVNVGAAGANQTWDFRNVPLSTEKRTHQFLAPSGTPFAAQFPLANLAQRIILDGDLSENYLYLQITSGNFRLLGAGVVAPDTSLTSDFGNDAITPLPMQFNRSWSTLQTDTIGDFASFAVINIVKASNVVDAWGTVRLPGGDYGCLRLRSANAIITKTYLGGQLFLTDSSSNLSYSWISKNDFVVAEITSQDEETNLNFTDAASFGRLVSTTTGVAERDASIMPAMFTLEQNYPNPFNPATQIAFQLQSSGLVEMTIYNLLGEKVRTLLSAPMSAGSHTVTWNGRDEQGNSLASGIYLYRLKVGGVEQMKRMALVK